MNILLINHYAGSPNLGMEFRPYYLAKEWVELGHSVTIVGANCSHLRSNQPKSKYESIDGIDFIWFNTIKYKNTGFKRILNILSFVLQLIINKQKLTKNLNPDVVIASSTYTLDIYPAFKIAKKSNAKLVFELHDMWPLSPMIIGGYSKHHPFIKAIQAAENFACARVDSYISILSNTKKYLTNHGLKEQKFHHIPNGYSEKDYQVSYLIPELHNEILNKIKSTSKIIIGYTGGFSPSNALETLIKVAKHINLQNIEFVLIGNGPLKQELINKCNIYGLTNVTFLPAVPKVSIPELLKKMDILYAGGIKSHLHTFGTSYNKITDYMLSGKPIIFSVDDPNTLVKQSNCGFQVPAETPEEIIKAIYQICKMSSDERQKLGMNGKKYAEENLNYRSLAKEFINAVSN